MVIKIELKNATAASLHSVSKDAEILLIENSPSFGDEIRVPSLPNLKELHISRSGGKTIIFSGAMPSLMVLTITNTPIMAIDGTIGALSQLTKLVISLNFLLTSLPEEMGDLENLEDLEISYNSIAEFPEFLSKLQKLKRLRLSGNELHHVPDFIHRIYSIETIDLDENHIRIVPDALLKLANLRRLNLENNSRLEYIPPALLRISEYDAETYGKKQHILARQKQKAVYQKQRTMRLIGRNQSQNKLTLSSQLSSFSSAFDPIMIKRVDEKGWIREAPKDNFILECRSNDGSVKKYALKKSYFRSVVPYFVLESCEKGEKREYVSIEKYGVDVSAILPLASVKYLSGSAFNRFRLVVSNDMIKTRPKLLIKNTVLHNVDDLHAEHFSVLPERLIPYVRSYSHRWDTYINAYLRSGLSIDKYAAENPRFYVDFAASLKEGKKQILEFIGSLDEAFEKYAEVSDTDITVYRGTKDSQKMAPYLGLVAGFTSTTTNMLVAENFSGLEDNCCLYRLIVSAGVPFISVKKYSQHETEDEILLPRGVFAELVETIEPLDHTYIKEYVVRIRLVNESQFKQHRYVCKTYPVAHLSSVHKTRRNV